MTTLLKFSVNLSVFTTSLWHSHFCRKPIPCCSLPRTKFASFHQSSYKLRALGEERCWCYLGVGKGKDGILMKEEGLKRKKRMVLVRFNQGFGFGSGGGGDGGGDNNANARILGNLALAILLTYLSMTGQLGWVLDAIVSIWLIVVLVPIVGLGAFLWWAGQDMVQGTCPNCGNDFQIFKSTLNDELQLCPYCSQPFSVVDDKFVRESVRFTNESTTFGEAFSEFFPSSKKGKESSKAIVDVEAEIKDAE
ncbi:uncharacterized protein LOC123202070 [Mangifera indica]|uniref:uncharacterized protein LOC123202070 n=1 Tax=Mangifera indica TaxID=29780 RepID=UPI001CFC0ADB|nr:uncharacterized protein LOC123202070 [Mangifera indica]